MASLLPWRASGEIEVALGYAQIHSLGLVEGIASRPAGRLDLAFSIGIGAQAALLYGGDDALE